MSSGIREPWRPAAWPRNAESRTHLDRWLSDPTEVVGLHSADMTGARLPAVPWNGGWLIESDFTEVDLRGARLFQAHLQRSCFVRADLRDADFGKAEAGGADLYRALLDRASLLEADFIGASLCEASLQNCDLRGTHFDQADLRGANLAGVVLHETSLDGARLDDRTMVRDASGSMFGPCVMSGSNGHVEIGGAELSTWLEERGANVEILAV